MENIYKTLVVLINMIIELLPISLTSYVIYIALFFL